jgi:hypothetical protein
MQQGGLQLVLSDKEKARIAAAKAAVSNVKDKIKSGVSTFGKRVSDFGKNIAKKSSDALKNIKQRASDWNKQRHENALAKYETDKIYKARLDAFNKSISDQKKTLEDMRKRDLEERRSRISSASTGGKKKVLSKKRSHKKLSKKLSHKKLSHKKLSHKKRSHKKLSHKKRSHKRVQKKVSKRVSKH